MIPAIALMIGAYIVVRMLEILTLPEQRSALVMWAAILTLVIATGGMAHVLRVASEVDTATEAMGL